MTDITFKEGTFHNIVITIPDEIALDNFKAKIQVRENINAGLLFEFSTEDNTLEKNNNSISLSIPANKTVGKAGSYLWQMGIWTNEEDAIKFPISKFIIIPTIVAI